MRVLCLLLSVLACTYLQAEAPPIQQWIDEAIKAGGGVVTVPEGEHLLSEGLVIKDAQKLTLRGVDKELCVLKLSPTSQRSQLLTITGKSSEIQIIGLTFDREPNKRALPSPAISISKSTEFPSEKIFIRDCLFQDFTGPNIVIDEASEIEIERCSFRDGGTAISTHSVARCTFIGNHIIHFQTAFDLKNSLKNFIKANEVRDSQLILMIHHDKTQAPEDRDTVINNGFYDFKEALKLSEQTAKPKLEANENLESP